MDEELRGRLAALEHVAALTLHGTGRFLFASGWPTRIPVRLDEAKAALLPQLPNETARTAAEQALERMFEQSKTGLSRDH